MQVLQQLDALVTDYSSVAMDAGFMRIPVFIYADDIEKYIKNRGVCYGIFRESLEEL